MASALASGGPARPSPTGLPGTAMSSHDVERALVQGLSQLALDRLDETARSMETDLDRLRDSWATTYAEMREASEQRIAATRNQTQQYLQSISTGEADQPAPDHKPARQVPPGASRSGGEPPVAPGPPGPAGQPAPHAAEVTAQDIAGWSMAEYQAERERLGIGSNTSARGMFG